MVDCPLQGLSQRSTTAAPGTIPPLTSTTVPLMLPPPDAVRFASSAKPLIAQIRKRTIRHFRIAPVAPIGSRKYMIVCIVVLKLPWSFPRDDDQSCHLRDGADVSEYVKG